MAGGYNQLGYAKYYRVWSETGIATPAPTFEGYEVSLIFLPMMTVVPATATTFKLVGYLPSAADPCVPDLATVFDLQTIVACDDPPGTVPAVANVVLGGASPANPVAAGIACEVSLPCLPAFVGVVAVSGETAKYDVALRVGRLKRARF